MSSTPEKQECPTKPCTDLNTPQGSSKFFRDPYWYLQYYLQDADGDTQLHLLMVNLPRHDQISKMLINSTWPASLLDVRNNDGMTALHLAAMTKASDIVRLLLVAGANPMSKDNFGCIPLHYACRESYEPMITALTKPFNDEEIKERKLRGLSITDLSKTINTRNNAGNAPIHMAAEKGHLEVLKLLLELGAKVDLMNYQNSHHPIAIAIMAGHKHITEFLLEYYKKHDNIDDWRHQASCFELLKPLQAMGLEEEFVQTLKVPVEKLYLSSESDSDFSE